MAAGLPVLLGRDVVDVAGVLRIAAPGIPHIVEVVGAEDVTAETPALAVALARHVHGAEPDVVDAAHVPAAVVQPGSGRLRERQDVMVAAVDGVHEGDAVGTVGETQADDVRVERQRAIDVGGEHEHVRQPARPHDRRLGPHRRARHAFRRRRPGPGRLVCRRHLGRDLDLDEQAGRIPKPEAVALETLGRVDERDAVRFRALLQIGQVVRSSSRTRDGAASCACPPPPRPSAGHGRRS